MNLDASLIAERFPRSTTYDRDWVISNSMGPNTLWITESLCEGLALKPGQRVLDLGCGKALSSIFLVRVYGVEVWAHDLWIRAEDNAARVREFGLSDQAHPIHGDARALRYDSGFFDAIVSLDAYHYFGTEDLYLGYLARFLGQSGVIGMVSPGLVKEFEGDPPSHLQDGWHWQFSAFHSAAWWERHWDRLGKVDVTRAELLEDGWRLWAHWDREYEAAMGTKGDAEMIEADAGRNLGFVCLTARLRERERWGA